ncbi:trehalose 6-phosphate phosphatase [Spinactinospora alkalitolerans]|uniref:Trehalose 6-phosphate phosphatase n=1 Tax=Spinactinospora alkalitolerans TaxID=687207 RepID=A0A852TQR8_9ACTN|nr:trehalose-phosphatase [Spinactinospora alkalitolerans]NYE45162.1 trehalose 6-phosphate phosphatase [Spinactinospora alkalitolerans]
MPLPSPATPDGTAALDRIRSDPGGAVLAFDFDGTLAPIVPDPRDARAHPGVVPALARLAPLVRAVVIVTGRPAAVAVEYGGLTGVDGIVVLGQYGRERWEADRLTVPEPPPGVALVRAELPDLLRRAGAPEGTWIEDKEHALAVHTRRAPDPGAALELLSVPLAELAERADLAVEPGRMVIELRPRGMDKGTALTEFVTALEAASLLYAGDDLGDLAAFDAVERLRGEGVAGLTVCSGSDEVAALAERADLVVAGPAGVVELLDGLSGALGA